MNKNKLDSMLKTIDTFKHEPIYIGNCSLVDIATMLRQQQADKDRALRILKEVDGVLLDYIEQLEKKPMTTLSNGRGVALAVKYMIAVLEEAQEK